MVRKVKKAKECSQIYRTLQRKILLVEYRIRVIATPSWIEPQATYLGHSVVIFGEKSLKITVFSDENLPKLTIVRGLKIQKINRTPGMQWRGYGIQSFL